MGRPLAILLAVNACASAAVPPAERPVARGALDEIGLRADCDNRIGAACNDLGVLQWEQRQRARAEEGAEPEALFARACALGIETGCRNARLIDMLVAYGEAGFIGLEAHRPDAAGALGEIHGLCEHGSPSACFVEGAIRFGMPLGVGELSFEPRAEDVDLGAALARFARVCRRGSPDSCMALAIAAQLGRGRPIAKGTDEEVQVLDLLDEACRARVVIACNDVGLSDSAPQIRDYAAAVKHWQAACQAGASSSCITLAAASERTRFYSNRVSQKFFEYLLHGCVPGQNQTACDPDVQHKPEVHSPVGKMLERFDAACTASERSGCANLRLADVLGECLRTRAKWACRPFRSLPSALDRVDDVSWEESKMNELIVE
jgi:TPR repeat protein